MSRAIGSPLPFVAIGTCAGSLFLLPFAARAGGRCGAGAAHRRACTCENIAWRMVAGAALVVVVVVVVVAVALNAGRGRRITVRASACRISCR